MGPGIQTLKQISPEVLASSEASDVATTPLPGPPSSYPVSQFLRRWSHGCFLFPHLSTVAELGDLFRLLGRLSSLPPPVPVVSSLYSLLFAGGLDHKSQVDRSQLSHCGRDARPSPLSPKAARRLFLDLDRGVQK